MNKVFILHIKIVGLEYGRYQEVMFRLVELLMDCPGLVRMRADWVWMDQSILNLMWVWHV